MVNGTFKFSIASSYYSWSEHCRICKDLYKRNSTKLAPLHEMYNIAKLEIISEMII